MSPEQLIAASESKLRDAENNLASCVAALNTTKARNGGVPNSEVVDLAQTQAVIAQAYAALALAKSSVSALSDAPDRGAR